MDILNEIYLLVDLCGDTEKKYSIICKMNFFDTLIDARTGREIFIKDMYEDESLHKGLYCKNKFIPIDRDRVIKIIENDDINDYIEYLDEIEKKSSKKRVRRDK